MIIGTSLLVGTSTVSAQPDEAVRVGEGHVLVGTSGSRDALVLDDATRAAAGAALDGRSVGVVLVSGAVGVTIDQDAPEAKGAITALEALGASPVVCDRVEFTRKLARCGKKRIDSAVVLQPFPGPAFEAPRKLIDKGFAVVVIDAPAQDAPTDGSVRLRPGTTEAGLEQGRAAGAWAATAWPNADVTVAIQAIGGPPDPFFEAVSQGLLESLPTATILPQSPELAETLDANLYTGALVGRRADDLLAALPPGDEAAPVALFTITCPDPLPTDPRFAGCLDLGYEDVGAAAVDVIARLLTGGEVPAEIAVGPTIEVVTVP